MNESDVLDGEDKNANKISIMSFKELGLSEVTKADLIIKKIIKIGYSIFRNAYL